MEQTVEIIGKAIGMYGFPIVAAAAMFWYMVTEQRELRKVINENTQMLSKILEHFKGECNK